MAIAVFIATALGYGVVLPDSAVQSAYARQFSQACKWSAITSLTISAPVKLPSSLYNLKAVSCKGKQFLANTPWACAKYLMKSCPAGHRKGGTDRCRADSGHLSWGKLGVPDLHCWAHFLVA